MLISETDLRRFLWTDKTNIRWKDVADNLQVDAATACVERSGKYFSKIQFTVSYTFKHAPTVISSLKLFYRLHAFCC
jgi:hypothetical protein